MSPPPNRETPDVILLSGFAEASVAELRSRLEDLARVEALDDPGALDRRVAEPAVAVVGFGPELEPTEAQRALARVAAVPGSESRCHVVLASGPRTELFQDFVDDDQLFYLSQKTPPLADTEIILRSALAFRSSRQNRDEAAHRESEMARVLAVAESLARQSQPDRAVPSAARAVAQITDAERGECLLYDSSDETLWSPPAERGAEERRESAAAGVVSFVLRTGEPVCLERVGEDPRYDPGADNDHGSPRERFLAVRVTAADRRPIAVLVARRSAGEPPFSEKEQARLRLLADQISPLLGRFVVRGAYEGLDPEMAQIFRREALDHHTRGFGEQGDLLQISPAWTPWAYRLTLLAFLVAFAYAALGSIHEYASGPALVHTVGRTEVIATTGGIAMGVEVSEGETVEAGQLLIRLFGAREATELERLREELEGATEAWLRDPTDPETARTVGALEERMGQARSRIDERSIRAPRSGIVGELEVTPGKPVAAGETVLSLHDEEGSGLELLALFPGHYRPQLSPGETLLFSPRGYQYARQRLVIGRVGEEIVGPAKARAALGAGLADAIPVSGPVVLVHAELPAEAFESSGQRYAYHEGLVGSVEVRVRSQRILVALFPGLEALAGGSDG